MKGQSNFVDFIIALGIFLIILFVFISFNQSNKIDYSMTGEALMISDSLLSPGIPSNWTETEYYRPGLLEDNKLSTEKWEMFYNIMITNSSGLKSKYTLLSDFMIRIGKYNGGVFTEIDVGGISHITTDSDVNPLDIVNMHFDRIDRMERIIAYNGTLVIMEVIVWK
ncbi:MAG: hypothetical protein ACMXYL_02015 [Candidatus Woesearchaeota archaeon]